MLVLSPALASRGSNCAQRARAGQGQMQGCWGRGQIAEEAKTIRARRQQRRRCEGAESGRAGGLERAVQLVNGAACAGQDRTVWRRIVGFQRSGGGCWAGGCWAGGCCWAGHGAAGLTGIQFIGADCPIDGARATGQLGVARPLSDASRPPYRPPKSSSSSAALP